MSAKKDPHRPMDVNTEANNDNQISKENSKKSQIEIRSKNSKNNHLALDLELSKVESSEKILSSKDSRFHKLIKEYELGISKIIIYCINESTLLLNKSEALDVLKGRKSNKILTLALDELDTYSALSHCSEEWLKNFINELISQNYLQIKHNSRKELLTLNEKSLQLLYSNISGKNEKPENDSFEYDEELYEKLRILRNEFAAKNNFAPYIICNNTTLKEMAMKMPRNGKSMLSIKGVGTKFLENYGLDFLSIINKHLESSDLNGIHKNRNPSSAL